MEYVNDVVYTTTYSVAYRCCHGYTIVANKCVSKCNYNIK